MLWFLQAHDVDEIFMLTKKSTKETRKKKVNKNNNGIVFI